MRSITEFADRNGICRTQVYKEIQAGRLVARKLGRACSSLPKMSES
jgi:hypothetical protein